MFPVVSRDKLADNNSQRVICADKGFLQINARSQALPPTLPVRASCVDMRYDYSSDFLYRKLHLS